MCVCVYVCAVCVCAYMCVCVCSLHVYVLCVCASVYVGTYFTFGLSSYECLKFYICIQPWPPYLFCARCMAII